MGRYGLPGVIGLKNGKFEEVLEMGWCLDMVMIEVMGRCWVWG